jgi:hypothetical protein
MRSGRTSSRLLLLLRHQPLLERLEQFHHVALRRARTTLARLRLAFLMHARLRSLAFAAIHLGWILGLTLVR